jgi:hypothetical protein
MAEAGLYRHRNGAFTPVRALVDAHLINALLSSLTEGRPAYEIRVLAEEIDRRGLRDAACAEVLRREGR